MKFFKPEDFLDLDSKAHWLSDISDIANAKLEREGVRVYGDDTQLYSWTSQKLPKDTHQALLVGIEELPKKEHVHSPDLLKMFNEYSLQNSICHRCGVKLKAKWEIAE